jgi:hypothetical protein
MLIVVAISGDRNVIKKEAKKILNIKTVEYKYSASGTKNKSDISNNRFDWNHLRIIHKIPEPHHTERARNRGTTEKNHTGHCTHILLTTLL